MKKLIKNNLASLIVVIGLIVLGAVLAGDVIVDLNQGSLEVDNNVDVSGDVIANQIAFGGASISDDGLSGKWVPLNDNQANGIDVIFSPNNTASGVYSNYGLKFIINPDIDSGVSNAGGVSALYGSALGHANFEGTLRYMAGINFQHGMYSGTGHLNESYGVFIGPYHKSGTIDNSYNIFIDAPKTGGSVTNEWVIYSEDDAPSLIVGDWRIHADNKKLMLGASDDASIYWNGSKLVVEGGDLDVNGEVDASGVSGDGSGKVVCVKSDGNLGTCSDAPDANGVCSCG